MRHLICVKIIKSTVKNAAHRGEKPVEPLKSSAWVGLLRPPKTSIECLAGRGNL
ncbi:hypothetical protein MICAF_3800002 [Microcystis aeruginosa PCC 9807]|uniref:Uncharacterized protein n=2 Tax=Microcystis TaxID=1125 RepID=I4H8E4_MICAE|nr:hypothetical protein VL20_556 [Microcystis panniformis FACHB-1757]CCI18318.1 hypothetical protein MICAF_3800002 [Microcystis aeruginosa PCC 9807]